MKNLDVFRGLPIPVEYAPIQKYAIFAKSDGGKTYTTAKMAEQLAAADLFFVILDPVGKHWSLRAGPDGDAAGGIKDIWVIGGAHGDVPLDPNSGSLIADTVVDHPGRYVIDTTAFEDDEEFYRFALDFGRRLVRRKMRDPDWPMLLMMEEAENFVPERPAKGQQEVKRVYGRIVRQARNYGIGVWMVFQRSQEGDKGAIGQCEVVIVKAVSYPRDLDPLEKWAQRNGTPEQFDELRESVTSLDVTEAYVWSSSWLGFFGRVVVKRRETYDSSASVKAGGARREAVKLVPLDVGELGKKMAELAEKAKEEDPDHLRERIAELETALDESGIDDAAATEEAIAELEEQVRSLHATAGEMHTANEQLVEQIEEARREVSPGLVDAAEQMARAARSLASSLRSDADTHEGFADWLEEAVKDPDLPPRTFEAPERPERTLPAIPELPARPLSTSHSAPHRPSPAPPSTARRPAPQKAPQQPRAAGQMSNLARELIDGYIAFAPEPLAVDKLGVILAKSSNSGKFRQAVKELWEDGYLSGHRAPRDDSSPRSATAKAIDEFGRDDLRPPTAREVQERWRTRLKSSTALMIEVFEVVVRIAPRSMTPEQIGQAIGKSHNSGKVRQAFKQLDSLQVLVYDRDAGTIKASPYLSRPSGA